MLKKFSKLGFTLIELLAVIVVIVVVLAIAIPLVSNIIETVKREAFKATAYSISDSGRFLMANEQQDVGYQEFYYRDGVQYNADNLKLDYSGDGPKTGVVILNENSKVVLAIHNGTYCAKKSANENKVTVSETTPEACTAYDVIATCDSWNEIALKYDVTLASLLAANNVTDANSSTCGLDIKIPLSSSSASTTTSGGKTVYYKTYYSLGYTTYSENFASNSYEYTIKLGVLPLNISDIEVVRVTTQSVFESLDDFKRYITKKNMGEVIWPGDENPAELDISEASVFKDHSLTTANMSADDVTVMCDETACYATLNITIDNMNNINPNTMNDIPVVYLPVKFTVEFNGQADTCAVRTTADMVPGTLAGTGTSTDPYLVESIEDLVALSNNVNAGNSYGGKYLSFTNSFDFKNSRSYKDSKTKVYGDLNGNGTIEELKTELTTGGGFIPIGNNTTRFSGRLYADENCIFNLYINRPSTSYVGLFGYSSGGVITNLTLTDIGITGADFTGGIAGVTENSIIDSNVSGNVTGGNYVGLIAGNTGNTAITSVTVEGNIVGADQVGGITGHTSDSTTIRGIYKGGSIVATGGSVGRLVGGTYYGWGARGCFALSSVTINGSVINSTDPNSTNGASISSMSDLNDINAAEMALDTYIGGDNDGNGYYWDYDETGALVHKDVATYPLTFSLSGSGTVADPYLISNYEELRQASLKPWASYRLTNNIDLAGKKFYTLGSHYNPYSGTFDGNLKTISNLTVNAPKASFIGLIGFNRGVVKNINLTSLSINGGHYAGGIAGNTENSIIDSNVSGNVTGGNYVGLIAGNTGNTAITSVTVEGNIVGADQVGGITGHTSDSTTIRGIYKGGSIVATGGSVGRLIGGTYYGWGARGCFALSSVTINGSVINSTDPNSTNGASISGMSDLNDINAAEMALDTYIGGDNDGNGYYWDYDTTGTLVHKAVATYPLTFSLSGSGTVADPYLISNYDDLRQASLKPWASYRLTNNIDLAGKRFYTLGSHYNPYSGTFDGNLKTISNLTVNAPKASFIGLIGFNRGVVKNINLTSLSINGGHYAGGIAGNTENSIIDSNVSGNVTGGNYVGLIAGNTGNTAITSVTVEGNIVGADQVGGITGHTSDSTTIRGIYKGGSIVATGGSVGRLVGGTYYGWGARGCFALSSVTINGSIVNSTDATSTNGASISSMNDLNDINAAEMALDTYIGGDNDGNGYYWDYDTTGTLVHKAVATYPLTFSLSGSGTVADPYLISNYDDLRQASLKTGASYRIMNDIDLTGKRFYTLGSHYNPYSGTFDGNGKTISNLTINASKASYIGLIGFNRGIIKGITITNTNIIGNNYVGCLTGHTENRVMDSVASCDITGNNYVGIAVGNTGNTTINSLVVEGNLVGVSSVGGITGQTSDSTTVRGIYKGGSIIATGGNIGRLIGGTYYGWGTRSVSALSTITINGSTITSTDAASTNGLDILSSDLSSTSTYTDRGFNFTDETLDYIWYLDGNTAKVRAGSL